VGGMSDSIETLGTVQALSGTDIIEDVAQRVAAALGQNCFLRSSDEYQGYSARVVLEVQLVDVDITRVDETFVVGAHDQARPSQRFEVEIPTASPSEVLERNGLSVPESLARDVAGNAPEPVKRRFYAPRMTTQK
jgi:hypothetical protein